jgi:hypothetical protein
MCVCVFEIGKRIDGGDNCLGNVLGIHKVLLADGRLDICSSFIYGGLGVWLFMLGRHSFVSLSLTGRSFRG